MSRAQIMADLLIAGWRPPTIDTDNADRLLDDIRDVDKYITRGDGLNLSERELVYLRMSANGMSAPQIAEKEKRSVHTVNDALASIRLKLSAQTTTHAVAIAIGLGIIEAPQ